MKLNAIGSRLTAEPSHLTSGSVNWFRAEFEFDAAWDEMLRTAVFRQGGREFVVFLGNGNTCVIPWEVLEAGDYLFIAVWGAQGQDIVLATNYVRLGLVEQGAKQNGSTSYPPTPDVYRQILTQIESGALAGPPGETPFIGDNGNWWVGETDTGVPAGDVGLAEHKADKNAHPYLVVDGNNKEE